MDKIEFMSEFTSIQISFFKNLQQIHCTGTLLANELASLLKISRSEAYNKMSGKSQLTMSQLYILCRKFKVPFEINPVKEFNSCKVAYTPFHSGNVSISDYVLILNKSLNDLTAQQLNKFYCTTDDIPFFHLFKYPELAAFKLHFWENRISKSGQNKVEKVFDFKKANKKDIRNAQKLHKTYLTIPGMEIWTKSHLLITPDQVQYALESKLIKDRELGKSICEQLLFVLDDIEEYAINSSKSKKEIIPFEWYQCDVIGNVTYLATTAQKKYAFLRFNTLNNFQTSDEHLCQEVEMWFNSLLNNSTGFSGHGSRHRNIYLNNARKVITSLGENF